LPIANVLDFETTGKFTPEHRIIEASIRTIDLDSGIEIGNRLYRFNPERNIDAKAQAVHGISIEELKHEPTIIECLPEIIRLLAEADVTVAHNGDGFDFPFLEMEIERVGLEVPEYKTFDTMVNGTFATDLGKNPNLRELCFSLDVEYDDAKAHSGDYDTLVLSLCLLAGIKYGWFTIT
jgi:DNA polymerase-3 subunit epsilon